VSNCRGCSKQIKFKYRTHAGEPITLPNGDALIEDLCDTCITASRLDKPEDYYDDLWKDSNAHPSHRVVRRPKDYLL